MEYVLPTYQQKGYGTAGFCGKRENTIANYKMRSIIEIVSSNMPIYR